MKIQQFGKLSRLLKKKNGLPEYFFNVAFRLEKELGMYGEVIVFPLEDRGIELAYGYPFTKIRLVPAIVLEIPQDMAGLEEKLRNFCKQERETRPTACTGLIIYPRYTARLDNSVCMS